VYRTLHKARLSVQFFHVEDTAIGIADCGQSSAHGRREEQTAHSVWVDLEGTLGGGGKYARGGARRHIALLQVCVDLDGEDLGERAADDLPLVYVFITGAKHKVPEPVLNEKTLGEVQRWFLRS
jgi:hypothetical protein